MTWFFAILIVLAMGGIAMVAAGRGAPLSEAYDDRPDVLVPEHGTLSAEDLRRARFPLAFRGYRMSEVDALLERLATQLDVDRHASPPAEPSAQPEGHPWSTLDEPRRDGPGSRDRRGDPAPD